MREEQNENQTSRAMEGALNVYGSHQIAEEAILHNQPITAVLDHKDLLHIPYRPIGRANTMRSSVFLMEIRCDDNEGTMIQNLCWVMSYSFNKQHYYLRISLFDKIKFHKRVCPNASNFE